MQEKITVTTPLLPPLEKFIPYLEDIWKRKWLTNNGCYHQELEKQLCSYLNISYISLFTNGTLPIITALQALKITGEVITTPYSFVATAHALLWNNITPVFIDIDPRTGNIDPDKIEAAITSKTTAILPVHVYGNPCEIEKIRHIAKKYKLKIIYDAAHAFGVIYKGKSILSAGDMSTISFHATKTYNTVEGGALICHDARSKRKIDYLKNFGFKDETSIIGYGINGKLDEIRSAYGLLTLKYVADSISKRKEIVQIYREELKNISGISFFEENQDTTYNYSYFPIFVDPKLYKIDRDILYEILKKYNIFGRRYFYPLISNLSPYKDLKSASRINLPIANRFANQVLCLPLHHELDKDTVLKITKIIRNKQ